MKCTAICFALIFIQCISIINGDVDEIKITPDEFFAVKNSLDFCGKVVLVSGSSSGIGAATARLFSYLGAKVVVTGRNGTRIKEVVNDCWKLSPDRIKVQLETSTLNSSNQKFSYCSLWEYNWIFPFPEILPNSSTKQFVRMEKSTCW